LGEERQREREKERGGELQRKSERECSKVSLSAPKIGSFDPSKTAPPSFGSNILLHNNNIWHEIGIRINLLTKKFSKMF
jgi:hypothetical protein